MESKYKEIIGVAGAGTMGAGIAQVAAFAGYQTLITDENPLVLEKAKSGLEKTFSMLVSKGKIEEAKSKEVLSRIRFVESTKDFIVCTFIIEAIIENLGIKQKLFADLEKIVSQECILATNTSSLSVTSVAAECSNPARVIGVHFFNPAPLMPLVEIISGVATSPQTEKNSKSLVESMGKTVVLAKDTPGFIVNRVARPFYGEAIRIYEEGIADFSTIDWAMKKFGGFKMGPFELMDMIGNDINYTVTETVWKEMFYDPRYKPSLTQKRLFESKRFGRKTGRGYYDYIEGAEAPKPIMDKYTGEEIFYRVLAMLINEAADAAYLNIASMEDIDLAMTKGVNYPKGLLKWCDDIGAAKILDQLNHLYEMYGEDRYRASVLLKKRVQENKTFF